MPPSAVGAGGPSAALLALLAQLGSQQERLQQLSQDVGATLSALAAEADAGQAPKEAAPIAILLPDDSASGAEAPAEHAPSMPLPGLVLEADDGDPVSKPDGGGPPPVAAKTRVLSPPKRSASLPKRPASPTKRPASPPKRPGSPTKTLQVSKGENHSDGAAAPTGRKRHNKVSVTSGISGVSALSPASSHSSAPSFLPELVTSGDHLSAWELLEEANERPRRRSLGKGSCRMQALAQGPSEGAEGEQEAGANDEQPDVDAAEPEAEEDPLITARMNAIFRLQARLGKQTLNSDVTAEEVHRSITLLGLEKYSHQDIEMWMESLRSVGFARPILKTIRFGDWAHMASRAFDDYLSSNPSTVPMKYFADLLLDDQRICLFDGKSQEMCLTIREVLFSGDANRLVAELTHVCVDDVAAPNERPDTLTLLEPVVALMILLNGVSIGVQSGLPESNGQAGWFWANSFFTVFFVFELLTRATIVGIREFFSGVDRYWNLFDFVLIGMAVFDMVFEAFASNYEIAPITVIRILRLTRLTRLVRIFRLRQMRELTLMVKGLLGGFKTLFWAVILLFFTVYMVACILASVVGHSSDPVPELANEELLSTVPRAFFTCFRCFMGDCNTSEGKPIVPLLLDRYGAGFALSYSAVMTFVILGLFNLIVAIYIENTLNAARAEGERNQKQRQRESIRVARLTRQLLKRFYALHGLLSQRQDADASQIKQAVSEAAFIDIDLTNISTQVSKEMFLCIIQDSGVQQLMDDLDIPDERAMLFDILDADDSGTLEVVELVTGLLKVRGEARKSDTLATLLAVRVVQDMLRTQQDRMESMLERLSTNPRVLDAAAGV